MLHQNERSPETLWRDCLLPSLSANDISFAGFIWDYICHNRSKLKEKIMEFACRRSWTKNYLQDLKAKDFSQDNFGSSVDTLEPSTIQWNLWSEGILVHSPEHGTELHVATLMVLDMKKAFEHRLWRSQTPLLLPLIDRLRLDICQYLTDTYGLDWPKRKKNWPDHSPIPEDPLACELGSLKIVVEDCMPKQKHLVLCIRIMKSLRNKLAHYSSVEYDDFYHFWSEVKEAGFSL